MLPVLFACDEDDDVDDDDGDESSLGSSFSLTLPTLGNIPNRHSLTLFSVDVLFSYLV